MQFLCNSDVAPWRLRVCVNLTSGAVFFNYSCTLSPLDCKSCALEVARKRQPREWGGFLYLHTKKLSPLNAKAVPWRLRESVNLASGAVSFTYILKNYPHSMLKLCLGGCAKASTSRVGRFPLLTY